MDYKDGVRYTNPIACEICPTLDDVEALAERRWRVRVFEQSGSKVARFLNLGRSNVIIEAGVNVAIFMELPSEQNKLECPPEGFVNSGREALRFQGPHFVRCKTLSQFELLVASGINFPFLAIREKIGPWTERYLRDQGFVGFAGVDRKVHTKGGPAAEGLDYSEFFPHNLKKGLELHAMRI